jgi:alpha-beta hydrolase superfamily lysophospholipase
VQNQLLLNGQLEERAGYFPVSGAHLYTVLHEVKNPVARVLLVGPFASERHNSYLPWVRWARSLAAENIEVLRYDYRGIGESTGDFEQMTFANWSDDVRLLAAWLADRTPHAPLVLHGLGMGAVLAGRAFDAGLGDALLLWSAPASANQALRATLMRWVGLEQIFKFGPEQKSASDYIRELEQGSPLEVDGYRWPVSLWRDSFAFTLPAALANEESAAHKYQRPVRIVKLTRDAAPLSKGGLVGYDDLKDFSWLYAPNREWIEAVPAQMNKGIAYA